MKANPYIGPRPFERTDRRHFYGRAREARDLLALIKAERAVLLYAQSGAGKTSLLNAQIIPALEDEGFHVLPIARVGSEPPPGIDLQAIPNVFVFSALMGLAGRDVPAELLRAHTLLSFLRGTIHPAQPAQGPPENLKPPILILDQSEEILTTHRDRWQDARGFFAQLQEALRELPTLGVVLAMREDHLAGIDPYAPLLPKRLRIRFRMELLGRQAALEAVQRPAQEAGCPFDQGVAERLVGDLSRIKVPVLAQDGARSSGEGVAGPYVEPVQLQVVCQRLWENLPEQADYAIQWEEVGRFGNIDRALTDFYESALQTCQAAKDLTGLGVTERRLRRWFSEHLITPMGTRGLALRGKDDTAELPNAAVDLLENRRLIRGDVRAGSTWYELAHDRLIEPVLQSNRAWEAARQTPLRVAAKNWLVNESESLLYRDKALTEALAWAQAHPAEVEPYEQEFLTASQQANQARLKRRRLYVSAAISAVVAVAIMVVLTVFAVKGRQDANEQRTVAVTAQAVAETRRQEAAAEADARAKAQATAEAARDLAKAAQAEADNQRQLALARLRAAQAQAVLDNTSDGLVRGTLLALESVSERYTPEGDLALRQMLGLLPRPTNLVSHEMPVAGVAFSPNGKWMAVGEGCPGLDACSAAVNVWEWPTGRLAARVEYEDKITGLAFSADGQKLVAGSYDGIARVIETATGREIAQVAHSGLVYAVALSPDGKWAASTGDDGARLWEADTGREAAAMLGQDRAARAVAFSPDGQWLASGDAQGTLRVWNTTTRRQTSWEGHPDGVSRVIFSPGGQWLASGGNDGMVMVWQVETWKRVAQMELWGDVSAIAFGSGKMAAGSQGGDMQVWDTDKWARLAQMRHEASVNTLVFSPNGRWLASGGEDMVARVWNAATGQEVARMGHEDWVYSVAFSADGRWVASGGLDGLRVWDALGGQGVAWLESAEPVKAVAFSPDGSRVVVGGDDRAVRVWEAATGKLVSSLTQTNTVNALAFSADGQKVAVGVQCGSSGTRCPSTVTVWDVAAGESVVRLSYGNSVRAIAIGPNGQQLVTGGEDGTARLWDLTTGGEITRTVHRGPVTAVAFSSDGQRVMSGSRDGLNIVDIAKKQSMWVKSEALGFVAALSADGRWAASESGTNDKSGTLQVWEIATGKKVSQMAHSLPVRAVAFDPTGQRLAMSETCPSSGSCTAAIRVWQAATGEEIARSRGTASALAFAPDGKRWVFAGDDRVARVAWLAYKDLVAEACARLPRDFTPEELDRYIGSELYHRACPNLPKPKS